jgi:acid phosphatase (class A)
MLAEVAPAYQNQILARAYVFGENRVVVGFHWPTDIDAGRLLAASIIANLQSNAQYRSLIIQARNEFKKLKG